MARLNNAPAKQTTLFGTPDAPTSPQNETSQSWTKRAGKALEGASLAEQLSGRLAEKCQNYERAAARLELRGEHDAADVLRKAAGRLRLIRNMGATGDEDSAL